MAQYFMFEGHLMGELSVSLQTDIVSKAWEIADFNAMQRPEIITENQHSLLGAGIGLYDALLDIIEAIKHGNDISSNMTEAAIAALKKANIMSEEELASTIGE